MLLTIYLYILLENMINIYCVSSIYSQIRLFIMKWRKYIYLGMCGQILCKNHCDHINIFLVPHCPTERRVGVTI